MMNFSYVLNDKLYEKNTYLVKNKKTTKIERIRRYLRIEQSKTYNVLIKCYIYETNKQYRFLTDSA